MGETGLQLPRRQSFAFLSSKLPEINGLLPGFEAVTQAKGE